MVLPDDSGPYISMIRPFGNPPMPKAISNPKEPVEMASIGSIAVSPNFIMVPLPYDFSSLSNVSCKAFSFSSLFSLMVRFVLVIK
ncbi:hypothetical protein D3C78_1628260 [compost metagenome]